MGTNAHSLCMRHRRPFIVTGPEHYCSALHNLTACAVPIFEENGEVIASLLFTRTNPGSPWSKSYHKLLSHTVGLITSIAAAIESRLYYKHCFTHMRVLEDKVSKIREHGTLAGYGGSAVVGDAIVVGAPSPTGKAADWAAGHNGERAGIRFDDIIYKSEVMANAIELAKRFAKAEENILITGESGTGKEYFAQAIHNYSSAQGPFMSINCAAIPHRLIESELFGYEPGTFTGAQRGGKAGKIELAHGGTLFLDEIGDMPLELQATLLRVLENKLVMRLGGKSYKKVDFRVVAATNRNLMTMVADGSFREDLFYRLSILAIKLPPLRERQDDLDYFIQYFLDETQRRGYGGFGGGGGGSGGSGVGGSGGSHGNGGGVGSVGGHGGGVGGGHGSNGSNGNGSSGQLRRFSPDAIKLLKSYSWPGNVRQLRNVVVSTYYASQDLLISAQDLPAYLQDSEIDTQNMLRDSGPASLSKLEEMAIKSVLERTGYNVAQTAKQLGVSKATLYRKLKEYNLPMDKRS